MGPLTYRLGDQHILIGVVSGGTIFDKGWTCGVKVSRFTRVAHVRGWIYKVMRENSNQPMCNRDFELN